MRRAARQRVRPDRFRCYLVTPSMGGLIARALLQNRKLATLEARRSVEGLFTFATPHNGVDVAGLHVPDRLPGQAATFIRERMALGNRSRARRRIYLASLALRQRMNQVAPYEPTGDEHFD